MYLVMNGVADIIANWGLEQDSFFTILKDSVLTLYNFFNNLNIAFLPFGLASIITFLLFFYMIRIILGASNG